MTFVSPEYPETKNWKPVNFIELRKEWDKLIRKASDSLND